MHARKLPMNDLAKRDRRDDPEPRWPALIALLAISGLYMALPSFVAVGPHVLLGVIAAVLIISLVLSHQAGMHSLNQVLAIVVNSAVTLALIISLVLLISALPERKEPPILLMRSAATLWVSNILVFALWYWRLDAGGPNYRDRQEKHTCGAFLFPQMILEPDGVIVEGNWSPNFVDYLFLAFNTSTALSPADTQALSRWAKLLMMLQSLISLTVIVLLAARAVNIL